MNRKEYLMKRGEIKTPPDEAGGAQLSTLIHAILVKQNDTKNQFGYAENDKSNIARIPVVEKLIQLTLPRLGEKTGKAQSALSRALSNCRGPVLATTPLHPVIDDDLNNDPTR